MTEIHGWGRYPRQQASVWSPRTPEDAARMLSAAGTLVPRGLGRSYGDSGLETAVMSTDDLSRFIAFDDATGDLTCDAGVSLDEILRVSVPRGWFLPVTPGTRYVTLGGAIASDVHGKNHHVEGTFGRHVLSMRMLVGTGEILTVSPTEHADLFAATCGGMGLTGVILSATIRLKPIRSSLIHETTIKAPDLEAALAAFEETKATTYSVAWIDCLARGRHLGRSLLTVGEHADSGPLTTRSRAPFRVPIDLPSIAMNTATMSAFNNAYYHKTRRRRHERDIPFEPFFYPLDIVRDWNRLYGRPGFLQYQFVLPRTAGVTGLRTVLERIAESGRGSFLAVLKVFGPRNDFPLSFPFEGYTLALDFQAVPPVFALLTELDRIVQEHGGRLYLTKDARMTESMFKESYPRWEEFEAVRERYRAVGVFSSVQSRRLGLR